MGITAENLVERYQLTREEQDAYAARSQRLANAAIEAGRFVDEITPVAIPSAKASRCCSVRMSSLAPKPLPNPWPS